MSKQSNKGREIKPIRAWIQMSNGFPIQLGQRIGKGTQYCLAIFDSKRKAQKDLDSIDEDYKILPVLITPIKGRSKSKAKK